MRQWNQLFFVLCIGCAWAWAAVAEVDKGPKEVENCDESDPTCIASQNEKQQKVFQVLPSYQTILQVILGSASFISDLHTEWYVHTTYIHIYSNTNNIGLLIRR